jgi:hypothetical protein
MSAKRLAAAALLLVLLPLSARAADVVVVNGDPPGVGFNDPTPAVPVGGNPGTTLGEQALNVFQRAAERWGHSLVSTQPIVVIAFFTPLSCTATGAVLGAAGANWYFANVPPANGAPGLAPDTWYPAALAEKLTRQDIVADPDDTFEIFALFNSNLGKPGCLENSGWYYGLDNNEPANRIDLLAVVMHEFGHGLGFSVGPTNSSSGGRANNWPSVWESYMLDVTTGKRWIDMTNAERAASARNNLNLVWAGQKTTNVIPSVLDFRLEVTPVDPGAAATAEAQPASFGPAVTRRQRGTLVAPNDGGGTSLRDGCEPFPADAGLAGNFALVDRATCTFVQKALNAQAAGARAVIIANNAPGLFTPGGTSPDVLIPTMGISQAAGAALRAAAPEDVVLLRNPVNRTGTTADFVRLYAPPTFAPGSSVSHFDVSAVPNLLMEPSINSNLTTSVKNPDDLTRSLLRDIGW